MRRRRGRYCVGIFGESEFGKSTLSLAAMGYLRPGLTRRAGVTWFAGQDMFGADSRRAAGADPAECRAGAEADIARGTSRPPDWTSRRRSGCWNCCAGWRRSGG